MFGFVRPAACRSSAPRSVTDGCPYPPLPCRAKNRNKIQLFSHRKQEINGNGGGLLPPPADSFHRCGGPPPSRREVWGLSALSKIFIQLRVQGRNPARFKGGYGVPRGFKGEKSKSPPNPLGLAERVHSFHRCGGPPPSRREVWGFAGQGLRPCRRLHIGALRSPLSPFARLLEVSYTTPGAGSKPCCDL